MEENFSESLGDAEVVLPIEPDRIAFYKKLVEKTAKEIDELAKACSMPRVKSAGFWV